MCRDVHLRDGGIIALHILHSGPAADWSPVEQNVFKLSGKLMAKIFHQIPSSCSKLGQTCTISSVLETLRPGPRPCVKVTSGTDVHGILQHSIIWRDGGRWG